MCICPWVGEEEGPEACKLEKLHLSFFVFNKRAFYFLFFIILFILFYWQWTEGRCGTRAQPSMANTGARVFGPWRWRCLTFLLPGMAVREAHLNVMEDVSHPPFSSPSSMCLIFSPHSPASFSLSVHLCVFWKWIDRTRFRIRWNFRVGPVLRIFFIKISNKNYAEYPLN